MKSGLKQSIQKVLKTLFTVLTFVCLNPNVSRANCHGKFVNPISDICWNCLFPMTIMGQPVVKGEDTPDNPKDPVCLCPKPPLPEVPGVPVSFWEPARLVDVTREPFCLVNMGGQRMGPIRAHGQGTQATQQRGGMNKSFYHIHWYIYPVIYWLELLVDFVCLEKTSLDVAYITELDPLWNDDVLSFVLNPEAALFGNPIAQAACAADCIACTAGFANDLMFWCAGCHGSMYPFTGNINAHSGGVQASMLEVERFIAKLHREGLLWGYAGIKGLCQKYPMPIIRKSQYKLQMTYPIAQTTGSCMPIGRTTVHYEPGREYPVKGEDFGYLIWRKRNCCLL